MRPLARHLPARELALALGLALSALPAGLTAPLFAADADTQPKLTLVQRASLVELLQRTHADTLNLILDVDAERWDQKPAEDRWSIGEIVEHLVLAEGAIRGRIETMLEAGPVDDWQTLDRPALDQLVALGSDRSQKFTAPEPIQPGGDLDREEALSALMSARAASIRFVLETEAPLATVAALGPIGVVLDGGGWLGLLGAHNLRHNRQIEEVIAQLERLR